MEDFESYALLLSTIAQRMLGSRGDVEDIVQEAYLRYAAAAVPEVGSLKAYLMTIVTRVSNASGRLAREGLHQRLQRTSKRPFCRRWINARRSRRPCFSSWSA